MEALYLLASLTTTLLASTVLSLHLLLCLPFARPSAPGGGGGAARLYEGRVRHSRRRPANHAFEYTVRYALVNLDLLPLSGHLSVADARSIASTSGPVHLLTVPKNVGYEQNPLSIYYCYVAAVQEEGEDLKMCIAEVTNTPWGRSIRADAPGNNPYVAIVVQHPTLGNYFTAALHAKLVGQTSDSVKLATFFWLMPHKVAAGIYWKAFRLWLKNVRFLDHPRYLSGSYRDKALKRDLEIRSSRCFLHQKPRTDIGRSGTTTISDMTENSNHQDYKEGGGSIRGRWCVWRDAQWPWC